MEAEGIATSSSSGDAFARLHLRRRRRHSCFRVSLPSSSPKGRTSASTAAILSSNDDVAFGGGDVSSSQTWSSWGASPSPSSPSSPPPSFPPLSSSSSFGASGGGTVGEDSDGYGSDDGGGGSFNRGGRGRGRGGSFRGGRRGRGGTGARNNTSRNNRGDSDNNGGGTGRRWAESSADASFASYDSEGSDGDNGDGESDGPGWKRRSRQQQRRQQRESNNDTFDYSSDGVERGGGGFRQQQRGRERNSSNYNNDNSSSNNFVFTSRAAIEAAASRMGRADEAAAISSLPRRGHWSRALAREGMLDKVIADALSNAGAKGGGGQSASSQAVVEELLDELSWPDDEENDGDQRRFSDDGGGNARAHLPPLSARIFLGGPDFYPAKLVLNRTLANSTDWRTPPLIARDAGRLLDAIGAACACHRLAKISASQGASLEQVKATPGYKALEEVVSKRIYNFQPRQVANVLWSVGKLGDRSSRLLMPLVDKLERTDLRDWREQELSNALWAMGALASVPDRDEDDAFERNWEELARRVWEPVVAEIKRRGMSNFETQAMSNMVWSCAHLRYRDDGLLSMVADATVAACARAERELVEAEQRGERDTAAVFVEPTSAKDASTGKLVITPQSVSNTVWALTELDFFHSTVYEAAARDIRKRIEAYKAQEMCNVLYAFAKAGFAELTALAAIDGDCTRAARRAELTGQSVSNLLWSFATLKYYPERSIGDLVDAVVERAPWLGEQELANSLWALARLGYDEASENENKVKERPELAEAISRKPPFLEAVSKRVLELAQGFNAQACANTLWALAVLEGGTRMPCFNVLADCLASEVERVVRIDETNNGSGNDNEPQSSVIDAPQINQLFQALLLTKLQRDEATAAAAEAAKASVLAEKKSSSKKRGGGRGRGEESDTDDEIDAELLATAAAAADAAKELAAADAALPSIPDAVARLVTDRWLRVTQNTQVSVFQEDIAATLRELGVGHSLEFTTADGLFSVDIAIDEGSDGGGGVDDDDGAARGDAQEKESKKRGGEKKKKDRTRKIAIECDGPFHFAVNTYSPTGATKLRRRLLRMLGWSVLPIPFYDHYALQPGEERARYVAALLRTAGVKIDASRSPAPAEEADRAFAAAATRAAAAAASADEDDGSSSSRSSLVLRGRGHGAVLTAELIEAAAEAAARGEASPIAAPPGALVVPDRYREEQAAADAAEAAAAPAPPALSVTSTPSASSPHALSQRSAPESAKPREVEITPALVEAARRGAQAAQGGRGPRPREELEVFGLFLRRDAAVASSPFVVSSSPSNSSSTSYQRRWDGGGFGGGGGGGGFSGPGRWERQQQERWNNSNSGVGGGSRRRSWGEQQQQQRSPSSSRRPSYSDDDDNNGYRRNSSNSNNRNNGYSPPSRYAPLDDWDSFEGSGGRSGGENRKRTAEPSAATTATTAKANRSRDAQPSSSSARDSSSPIPSAPPDAAALSPPSLDAPRESRRAELSRLKVNELSSLAAERGIKGRSGMRKAELVEALLDAS